MDWAYWPANNQGSCPVRAAPFVCAPSDSLVEGGVCEHMCALSSNSHCIQGVVLSLQVHLKQQWCARNSNGHTALQTSVSHKNAACNG